MKTKLLLITVGSIFATSTVIAGVTLGILNKPTKDTPEQQREKERIVSLTNEYDSLLSTANEKLGSQNSEIQVIKNELPENPNAIDLQTAINKINNLILAKAQEEYNIAKTSYDKAFENAINVLGENNYEFQTIKNLLPTNPTSAELANATQKINRIVNAKSEYDKILKQALEVLDEVDKKKVNEIKDGLPENPTSNDWIQAEGKIKNILLNSEYNKLVKQASENTNLIQEDKTKIEEIKAQVPTTNPSSSELQNAINKLKDILVKDDYNKQKQKAQDYYGLNHPELKSIIDSLPTNPTTADFESVLDKIKALVNIKEDYNKSLNDSETLDEEDKAKVVQIKNLLPTNPTSAELANATQKINVIVNAKSEYDKILKQALEVLDEADTQKVNEIKDGLPENPTSNDWIQAEGKIKNILLNSEYNKLVKQASENTNLIQEDKTKIEEIKAQVPTTNPSSSELQNAINKLKDILVKDDYNKQKQKAQDYYGLNHPELKSIIDSLPTNPTTADFESVLDKIKALVNIKEDYNKSLNDSETLDEEDKAKVVQIKNLLPTNPTSAELANATQKINRIILDSNYNKTLEEAKATYGENNAQIKTITAKISDNSSSSEVIQAINELKELLKKKETELNSEFSRIAKIVDDNFANNTELAQLKSELSENANLAKLQEVNKKLKELWDKLRLEEGKKEENKLNIAGNDNKLELFVQPGGSGRDFNIVFSGQNFMSRFHNRPDANIRVMNTKDNITYFTLNFNRHNSNFINNDTKINFSTDLNGPNKRNYNRDFYIDKVIIQTNKETIELPLEGKVLKFNASKETQTVNLRTIQEIEESEKQKQTT